MHFDVNLNWSFHLNKIHIQAQSLFYKLMRLTSRTWGLSPSVVRQLYLRKVEPMLLYGCQVWWHWGRGVRTSNLLDKIQRPFLIAVSKCFRTVSTVAMQVMTGIPPLAYRAEALTIMRRLNLGHDLILESVVYKSDEVELLPVSKYPNPAELRYYPWSVYDENNTGMIHIFTDGSKMDGGVGAGLVVFLGRFRLDSASYKLSDNASVFQAELFAIYKAIMWCACLGKCEIRIVSDSRSALDAINSIPPKSCLAFEIRSLLETSDSTFHFHWTKSHVGTLGNELADAAAKAAIARDVTDYVARVSISRMRSHINRVHLADWKDKWQSSEKGRDTKAILESVDKNIHVSDFFVSQLVTNHGRFPAYLNRFFDRGVSCICGEPAADRDHYLYMCPAVADMRNRYLPAIGRGATLSTLVGTASCHKSLAAFMKFIYTNFDSLVM